MRPGRGSSLLRPSTPRCPGSRYAHGVTAVVAGLRAAIQHAITDRVRAGFPRMGAVPWAARVFVVTTVALAIGTMVVVFITFYGGDDTTREIAERSRGPFGAFLIGWTLTAARLTASALRPRARIVLGVIVWLLHLPMVAVAAVIASTVKTGWAVLVVIAALAGLALTITGDVRGARRPGGWLPVLTTVIGVGLSFTAPLAWIQLPHFGEAGRNVTLSYVTLFEVVAVPTLLSGALVFVRVALDASQWGVLGFREGLWRRPAAAPARVRRGLWWVIGAAGVVQVIAVFAVAMRTPPTGPEVIATAGVVAAAAVFGALAFAAARRRRPVERPHPSTIADHVGRTAPWWGALMFVGVVVGAVTGWGHWIAPLAVLPMSVVWSLRNAATGRTAAAALHAVVAALLAWATVSGALTLPQLSGLVQSTWLLVATIVVLGVTAARGHLDERRLVVGVIAVVIAVVHPWRTILAEPFTIFGESAPVVIVVGVVWLFLTEAGSKRLEHRLRVLLQNTTLVLATVSVLVVDANGHDFLELWADVADTTFGHIIVVAALIGLAELGRFDVDPDPRLLPPLAGVRPTASSHRGCSEQPA